MIVITICLTGTIKVVAQNCDDTTKQNIQFPSPLYYQMNLNYITWDDWSFCAGVPIKGPSYCMHFTWKEPNLSETESQLIGYKIYNYFTLEELAEIPLNDGQSIAQTINTYAEIEGWIAGYTWVTAIYSEPDGESAPSNIEFNLGEPPIVINKDEIYPHSIAYNSQMKTIEITGIKNIASIDIFDINGRFIATCKLNDIEVKHFPIGIYIIKITTETGESISDKLVIL